MTIQLLESTTLKPVSKPRLTIGIPTWNRQHMLEDQLRRLAPHLSDEVELVICDNGSTDETWDVISQFFARHRNQCRALKNSVNLGADVNYLRTLESASGEWVWLVGDDDRIDFSVIEALHKKMDQCTASVVILEDDPDANSVNMRSVDSEVFFDESNDRLGELVLQVGRVICRVSSVAPLLRSAYSSVGNLHAYSALYGPLIEADGLEVVRLNLLSDRSTAAPRWNIFSGYLGAWESSLSMYPRHRLAASRREIRLRQAPLIMAYGRTLLANDTILPSQLRLMQRLLSFKGKLIVRVLRASFFLSRPLARILLLRLKPSLDGVDVTAHPEAGQY